LSWPHAGQFSFAPHSSELIMTDREKEQTLKALNEDLALTLDKEELRDIEPAIDDQNAVRGGMGCTNGSCKASIGAPAP